MGNIICIAMFIDSNILDSVAGFCEHGIQIQLNIKEYTENLGDYKLVRDDIFFPGVSPRTPLK